MSPARRDALGGLIFLLLGLFLFYVGADLDLGSLVVPGPGALPKFALAGLIILSLVLIASSRRAPATAPQVASADEPRPGSMARVLITMALLVTFLVVLPSLGFLVASGLLMMSLAMLGAEKPFSVRPALAGLAVAVAAYVVFVRLLDVRLPSGTIWGA